MAEFKVNTALSGEITALESSGSQLDVKLTSVSAGNVSSLKTSVRFITEHESIIELLKLYKRLITKEASDLNAMKESAETLDASIAGKIN